MLYDLDRRLLRHLQAEPTLTAAELGARAGVSALKATRRLGRLQEHGVLKGQSAVLKPGMIVTVEPGVYIPNWGGIRIEDDVLVTRSGHEVLTSVPKQLDDCLVG